MATRTQESIVIHDRGLLATFTTIVRLWRARRRQRCELARLTKRELRDVGLFRSDIIRDVEKPFWPF